MQEPQETRVRPLGWEDPLEESVATRSSTISFLFFFCLENPMDSHARGAWQATVHRVTKSQTRLK